MASSKGIFSVSRADLLKFAAGKIQTVNSTPFSPLEGLQAVECKPGVQPSAWRMLDGSLSFSTTHGLVAIDPNRVQVKFTPPPLVIESVTIDGRSQTPAEVKGLAPGNKNLEFVYTALSFRVPSRIAFRYKLEGFDKNWNDAGTRRQASYTNLPPGNYRFHVTACNPDGTCNDQGASLAFTLPAFFYQRPWFFAVCTILAIFLARLAYAFRIQHLKRQFGIVLGERSRIARELHDTLIQGFSGVTMEMQALAARLPAGHREALLDIVNDAANCLSEARRSVAELRRNPAEEAGLAAGISQVAKQAAGVNGPVLLLDLDPVPPGLPAYVEYNLLRISQEAVTNCAKHSGAANIEVTLRVTEECVRLSVKDDGAGFQTGWDGESPDGHFGLTGMKERAKDIGADFRVDSAPRAGTTVAVSLPVRKNGRGILTASRSSVKVES